MWHSCFLAPLIQVESTFVDNTVVLFQVLSVEFCGIRVALHELSAIPREHTTQAVQR